MSRKRRTAGTKSFRAPPALLDKLEERAMLESIHARKVVTSTDLIRRGIEALLLTPVPGMKASSDRPCLVARSIAGHVQCVWCGEAAEGDVLKCKVDGQEVAAQ